MISGAYGFNNSGDEALLHSIIDGLRLYKPDIAVTVLSKKPRETRFRYGVNALFRFNFFSVYLKLKKTRLLVTGGGNLIQDETSTQSLIYYLWVINAARRLGVKNMLYANGIGPVLKPSNYTRVCEALDKVELITLRDKESITTLNEIGVNAAEVHVTADPAFTMPPSDENDARRNLGALGADGPFFCIALRDWFHNPPGLEKEIARFADYIVDKYGYKALFILMRPVEDTEISRRVITQMKNPATLVSPSGDSSVSEIDYIRGIVGFAEFMLGMRMHALVYAAEKAVPVIGLDYGPKIRHLMESMNQRFYMPIEETNAGAIIRFADELLRDKENIVGEIKDAGDKARELAALNAKYCARLMGWDKDEN
jgi:polysaccharide pyruvyl transferase CsaB